LFLKEAQKSAKQAITTSEFTVPSTTYGCKVLSRLRNPSTLILLLFTGVINICSCTGCQAYGTTGIKENPDSSK
jgi:hypothetical protein